MKTNPLLGFCFKVLYLFWLLKFSLVHIERVICIYCTPFFTDN